MLIDGRIETVGIQADPFGQKFPCPRNGLFFEIIAEGEVAQHLKEGAVAGSLAYVLQIACADALLAGSHACAGRDLLACEIGFEGSHARVDDQKALVIVGNKGEAVHAQMSLALKKLQKHLTQLIYTVFFHCQPLHYDYLHESRGTVLNDSFWKKRDSRSYPMRFVRNHLQ